MLKAAEEKVGIIGCGNMGRAIAERIKAGHEVVVFDKDAAKTKGLSGVKITSGIPQLVKQSRAIIIAIKPQDFEEALKEIKDSLQDRLVISIAAGITTGYIEKILGQARVIRVMPNLPARFGKAISCLCKGRYAYKRDLVFAKRIFKSVGKVMVISEKMMPAATAVSGSGPGFWGYQLENKPKEEWKRCSLDFFVPELTSAAESVGFKKNAAKLLAVATAGGSLATVEGWHISPGELKERVASRGGTTEAGLKVLQRPRGTLKAAVKAALKRAKELSRR